MKTNSNYRTAIVLQGGGALGAYEFGVLKALYEKRSNFKPSVVTGISIGAITTAVLAGAKGNPIQTLDLLWREKLTVLPPLPPIFQLAYQHFMPSEFQQSLAALGNPGMYRLRPEYLYAPLLCTSVYDLAPLRQTLAELVDLEKLNNGGIRVAVGAINIGTSLIKYFDNNDGRLSFDHVIASGSLPPGFPMMKIDENQYWDGGLFSNTPLSRAINYLEALDSDNPDILRELIVVELFPMEGSIPKNIMEVLNRMIQLQYTSRLMLDRKFFRKINAFIDLIQKINAIVPKDSDIRQDEGYRELCSHKKIDAFKVISASLAHELSNAADFSKASIEARIEAGYRDAIVQRIEEYTSTYDELHRQVWGVGDIT
jgi:NTE family protein